MTRFQGSPAYQSVVVRGFCLMSEVARQTDRIETSTLIVSIF